MLSEKYKILKKILVQLESTLIAYSGGVDSTFLLAVAKTILGKNVLAVIARSDTFPQREYREALDFVRTLNVSHEIIQTKELSDPRFSTNPENRCYYCKKELFTKLKGVAEKHKIFSLCDGSNADDDFDFRPGLQAIKELGIRSPLKEAGLTKKEIRFLSRQMHLPTWDKPAYACLSSRFPYGHEISSEQLRMVEKAEDFLMAKGFRQVRVRHNHNTAKIEVEQNHIPEILSPEMRLEIIKELKHIGYQYVTLDLEGYRTGSMNETLEVEDK